MNSLVRPGSKRSGRLGWLNGCLVLAGFGVSAAAAQAQPINIDYSTLALTPTGTYGAAPGQAGFWNNPAGTTLPQALLDTSGAITAATVTLDIPRPEYAFNNLLILGDDQALMDDALDLGGLLDKTRLVIDGLAPGFYGLYIYAWSPDSPLFRTGVAIAGGGLEQSIGGPWPGGQAQASRSPTARSSQPAGRAPTPRSSSARRPDSAHSAASRLFPYRRQRPCSLYSPLPPFSPADGALGTFRDQSHCETELFHPLARARMITPRRTGSPTGGSAKRNGAICDWAMRIRPSKRA